MPLDDALRPVDRRIDDLETSVGALARSRAAVKTGPAPRLPLAGVDAAWAGERNGDLLALIPGAGVAGGEERLVLAFASRADDLAVVLAARGEDAILSMQLKVGLDGAWGGAGEAVLVDGLAGRRVRFPALARASAEPRLVAINLRLEGAGRLVLTHLSLVATPVGRDV